MSRPAWQPRRHWEHRPGQARCGNDRQPDGRRRFVYLTVVPELVTCQPCREHLQHAADTPAN